MPWCPHIPKDFQGKICRASEPTKFDLWIIVQGAVSISRTDRQTGRRTILLWTNSMGRQSVARLSCLLKPPPPNCLKKVNNICCLLVLVDLCTLPKEIGPCRAAKRRYYFNRQESECQAFTYGGCQGNANRFLVADNCQRVCGRYGDQTEQLPGEETGEQLFRVTWYQGFSCILRQFDL